MSRIPSNTAQKWNVAHGRDIFADIVDTRNVNLDKEGYLKLSSPTIALYTTDDDANFSYPVSIFNDGTQYYWITSDGMFTTVNGASFTQTSDTGNQPTTSVGSDGVFFNSLATVTGTTTVKTYSGTTWTDRSITNSSSYPHPMCVVEHLNQLAVGNGNVVKTYNTSYTNQATLTLPAEYTVVWMRWRQNNIYIGTRNISGAGAKMFVWNGSGSAAQSAFGVQADWMFSGTEYMSSIAVVTSAGQLLRFNGGGFDEIAHFPVYETSYSWTPPSAPSSAIGKVAGRGMIAHGDVLYINIDGSVNRNGVDYPGNFLHEQPSGLWKYDPSVGLYHTAGYCFTKYQALTVTSCDSSILTVGGTSHKLKTGDPVAFKTVSGLSGVTANQTYYAIYVSDTTFSIAFTPGDALAGNKVILSGTPTSDAVDIPSVVQVSATSDVVPGPVSIFSNVSFYDFYGLELMWGGSCHDEAGNVTKTAMSFGLGRNVGYITTRPIYSNDVLDMFASLYQKIGALYQDSDSVEVKYRTVRRLGIPTGTYWNNSGKATWTSGTTFTVNNIYKNVSLAQIGDEVMIISGTGAGNMSKISTISNSGSTYTITLEDTIPGVTATDIGDVIIDNWTSLGSITNATETIARNFAKSKIDTNASWIQIKLVLKGRDIAIKMLELVNGGVQPTK